MIISPKEMPKPEQVLHIPNCLNHAALFFAVGFQIWFEGSVH